MLRLLSEHDATPASDMAACRALLANGSKTFFAASFLLPRRVREPASALYAFCRLADDAVDQGGDAQAVLHDLARRLAWAYQGRPAACAADRAFAAAVRRFQIPQAVPEALIEGFAWDFAARRYETLADLEAYAARVAGTVGTMMALVMGARDPLALARACDLGIAMQLTNIARDVGEDARQGRIYLPLAWLRAQGIDPDAWLADPQFDERLGRVVARLLAEADRLYVRSEQGLAHLPPDCRAGIRSARLLYAEIGICLARQGHDSVSRRAVVPLWRKLALLVRASLAGTPDAALSDSSLVEAARFLVTIPLDRAPAGHQPFGMPAWWNVPARFVRVIEIFERLERRDRGPAPSVRHEIETSAAYAPETR